MIIREEVLKQFRDQLDKGRIFGFFGDYRFLSNYDTTTTIDYKGFVFPSTEHAYQAMKVESPKIWEVFSKLPECKHARNLGQVIMMRNDWDVVKYQIMYEVNVIKFNHPELRAKLLATNDMELVENNWWNDVYWGMCNGVGQSKLGEILMKIRSEINANT